jgi:hypothetical protein
MIPKTKYFLIRNYGDLNEKQNTQLDNHQLIEFEERQETFMNLKVGVLTLVCIVEFLYPAIFYCGMYFAVLVGKLTGQI